MEKMQSFSYKKYHFIQQQGLMTIEVLIAIYLVQVQLRTEVPRTPNSTQLGFELMTSRS